eukprot:COSAG01_NODE_25579_length_741_cov_1.254290_1_plen_51_part_10
MLSLGLTFWGLGWRLEDDDTNAVDPSATSLGIALVIGNQDYANSAWPQLPT